MENDGKATIRALEVQLGVGSIETVRERIDKILYKNLGCEKRLREMIIQQMMDDGLINNMWVPKGIF